MTARRRRRAPAMGAESGFTLIEVVVAASVLLVVVLGVLGALDVTTRAAGHNRDRTVAASLAEQNLERMRGLRAKDLMTDGNRVDAKTVAGVPYTVTSKTEWVQDSSNTAVGCSGDGSAQGSYLRITSRAVSKNDPRATPVTLSSLMAPPVGAGQLAVQVLSSDGSPRAGVPVSLASGPQGGSATTNQAGCAIFSFLSPGAYTAAVGDGNLVDPSGNSPATTSATVTAATVTTTTLRVDTKATVQVQVETKVGANPVQPDPAEGAYAANPGVQPSGLRQFSVGSPSSSLTLTGLYPFKDGYAVYSGQCAGADPSQFGDLSYFAEHPEAVATPGPGQTATVHVREPALNVAATLNGAADPGARVVVHTLTAGCTDESFVFNSGRSSTGLTSTGGLKSPGPGLPFGRYTVCADAKTGRFSSYRRSAVTTVDNTNPDGTATVTLDISGTGSVSGTCP